MKIIHTADLHLDSKMESNLPVSKARERKNEILETFKSMISFAKEQDVKAILIAGDLFDKSSPTKFAANIVKAAISDNPEIDFYYLKGNHDEGGFLSDMEEIPDNLKSFEGNWKSYEIGEKTVISGIEFTDDSVSVYNTLSLDVSKINIVMMHGQENAYNSKDKTKIIALNELKNKAIDYLALGHIHSYKYEKLDARGSYCYPGCLEGRGFDECGEHGFVLLDVDEDKKNVKAEFYPFAGRKIYEIKADMTGVMTSAEAENVIDREIKSSGYDRTSLVKIVLTGEMDMESEINLNYLENHFADSFYFVKIKDETKYVVDYNAFAADQSLKGEFIRTVNADKSLSEEDKALIIKMGIDALRGEK